MMMMMSGDVAVDFACERRDPAGEQREPIVIWFTCVRVVPFVSRTVRRGFATSREQPAKESIEFRCPSIGGGGARARCQVSRAELVRRRRLL